MSSREKHRNFLDNMARKRADNALAKKELLFAQQHADDSDEQLLAYLRQCAERLGHSPNISEVIGGGYIAERFGSWSTAIRMAGLQMPGLPPKPEKRKIFREEVENQKRLFLAEKRAARETRAVQKTESVRDEERLAQEKAFCQAHCGDTDEALLDYLRQCAAELGHSPYKREVQGHTLIRERFDSWAVALMLAGLELPKDMKQPNQHALEMARRKLAHREE